ncbi:helix-turn-helix domain-containing protein [Leuconostoc mesenteroides]
MLFKLLSYPNQTFSRSQLLDVFWGVDITTGCTRRFLRLL